MSPRSADQARDRAQLILGAISLGLWLLVSFALSIRWFVDEDTPQPIFMAGGIALIVAAVPWLAYPAVVKRLRR